MMANQGLPTSFNSTNYARIGHAAQQLLSNILQELLFIKEPPFLLQGHVINNTFLNTTLRPDELLLINNVTTKGEIAARLEMYLGKQNGEFVSKLDNLKFCCMDSEIANMYIRTLEELKDRERELEDILAGTILKFYDEFIVIDGDISRVDQHISRVDDGLSRLGERVFRIEQQVSRVDDEFIGVHCDLSRVEQQVSRVDEQVLLVDQQVSRMNENISRLLSTDTETDAYQLEIDEWESEVKHFFVETTAITKIVNNLKENNIITITGISGVGKSVMIRHVALFLRNRDNHTILPCCSPNEIEAYYRKNKDQVFVFDDVCGRYTAIQSEIEEWVRYEHKIKRILKTGRIKLLASCRSQVFKEFQVQRLKLFTQNVLCFPSEKCSLTLEEKVLIAQKYLSHEYVEKVKHKLNDERTKLKSFKRDHCDFTILIEENNENHYFNRITDDISKGRFDQVLNNTQFKFPEYLSKLMSFMITNDQTHLNRMINAKDENGSTPLIWACLNRRKDVVEMLMKTGADINLVDFTGNTPLQNALDSGNVEIAESLISKGANVHLGSSLHSACRKGYRHIVELIINKGVDINKRDNRGRTPLLIACSHVQEDLVNFSLDKSCEIHHSNKMGDTPLSAACRSGSKVLVQKLLSKGANVNKATANGWTALMSACNLGYKTITDLLIQHDAKMNCTTNNGWTPLMFACGSGSESLVLSLIKKGADMFKVTTRGWSALACEKGHYDIVTLLLQKN
ncbi:unnamed protein product [Mytilus coruscus]|uniref:Novel STAND NTPase 3 domain-containing protein n=1 Tax=Mytilus coruscus TaxID=42192 RepID=A0A6J8AYI0_MYTCO|nr:unnamed protein product [Mytilus coruscus]